MVLKIISGAQTGADIAGLDAAIACRLETGGFMPAGFRTQQGSKPEYEEKYKVKCTSSYNYPPRTELNVLHSDGTILFGNMNSPGCKLTMKLCNQRKKPFFVVAYPNKKQYDKYIEFINWLMLHNISCLNVAGNREEKNKGIYTYTYNYLTGVFAVDNLRKDL